MWLYNVIYTYNYNVIKQVNNKWFYWYHFIEPAFGSNHQWLGLLDNQETMVDKAGACRSWSGYLQHVQLLTCQVPSFANQHCQSETWMTPWCLAHMTIRVCRGPFEHLMVRLYAHSLCMENICWALRSLHLLCCLIGGAVETPFGWELNLLPVCTRYSIPIHWWIATI